MSTFTHELDLLSSASGQIVELSETYQAHIDHLRAAGAEAATTVMIGVAGNALANKLEEFAASATQFVSEINRVGEAVGTFGTQATEMDDENVSSYDIDVSVV